jgi:hypothetical protein
MNQIAGKNDIIGVAVRLEINKAVVIALVGVPLAVEIRHHHGCATIKRS